MVKIAVVVGSVRQTRVSSRLAQWVLDSAKAQYGEHDWELVDLKDYNLPMFDELFPPMAGKRPELGDNIKRYLEVMGSADAFIIVTPEYNHGIPSGLKNAIDLLDYQLMKKPVAIVSHGSVGGARANEQLRLVVNSNLGAVPVPATLTFYGNVAKVITDEGAISEATDGVNSTALDKLLEQLLWYSLALKEARI